MKHLILLLAVAGFVGAAHAEETTGEKAAAKGNDAKRSMKKSAHKMEEAVCAEGDAKCAAKKAGHKGTEAGDAVKDKAKEGVNKVD
jgi:hypothetical protein